VTPTVKQHKCKIEIKISIFSAVAENCELLQLLNRLPLANRSLIFETLFRNQVTKVCSLENLFGISESCASYFLKAESFLESKML